MGYYNDISLNDIRTTDDDWYDRKDYGRVVTPPPPPCTRCNQRPADVYDPRTKLPICARCWLKKRTK